ncbi:hypothetical protein [Paracoccus sp. NSM]|uniref:hypothetical protein n=1 Tax=Paracoccus sp. NSM TaxID=3457784 RepID=UPI004036F266
MNENEWVAKVSGLVGRLDATEQMIFMAALRALANKEFTVDQFTEWAGSRIERHRAGEVLHLSDLETGAAA